MDPSGCNVTGSASWDDPRGLRREPEFTWDTAFCVRQSPNGRQLHLELQD